jgi:hypothetical protein
VTGTASDVARDDVVSAHVELPTGRCELGCNQVKCLEPRAVSGLPLDWLPPNFL